MVPAESGPETGLARALGCGNRLNAEQSTGRIVHVPNHMILFHPVFNYNKAFQYIWNEITVLITFDSDWKKAEKILYAIMQETVPNPDQKMQEEIRESARRFMIYYRNVSPNIYTNVVEDGIQLIMRFLCHPRRNRWS